MKKIKCFFTLILLFFITGCSNYDMSMKIEKDKSMVYTLTILSNYYNDTLNNNISIYKKKFEQYGYSVEEYNVNNKYGMIISKQFDNIDDISYGERSDEFNLLYLYTDGYNADIENKMFNVDEGIATNRYAANFYVDLSNLGIDLNNAAVTYSVELPNASLSNNASFVSNDQKTLTWNITSLGKTEIDYVFELNSYDNIYYIVSVFIAIYLFFSIISNLFRKVDGDGEKRTFNNVDYSKRDDVNKKVENLTNNAIKNSTNNVNNVSSSSVKPIPKTNSVASSVTVIPPTKVNNMEMIDDITSFKTPENKNTVFGIFNGNKNQSIESNTNRVNNNEEFNRMINNINSGNNVSNIDSNDEINNVVNTINSDNEQVPNPFGNSNINANGINANKSENDIANLMDIPVIYNDNNNTIINDNNVNINNNKVDDEINKIEPIYNIDNNTNVNTYISNENNNTSNIEATGVVTNNVNTNNDVNNNIDNYNEDVTFQSLNKVINDVPVIRVNSQSVVLNNEKNDE